MNRIHVDYRDSVLFSLIGGKYSVQLRFMLPLKKVWVHSEGTFVKHGEESVTSSDNLQRSKLQTEKVRETSIRARQLIVFRGFSQLHKLCP